MQMLTQSSLGFCHTERLLWGCVWARWWVKAGQTAWCLWSFHRALSGAPWNIQTGSFSHCPPPEPHTWKNTQTHSLDTPFNKTKKSINLSRARLTQKCHLFPWFGWGHHPVYKFYGTYDCKHLPPSSRNTGEYNCYIHRAMIYRMFLLLLLLCQTIWF